MCNKHCAASAWIRFTGRKRPHCGNSIATYCILRRDNAEWNTVSIWATKASGSSPVRSWRRPQSTIGELENNPRLLKAQKDEVLEKGKMLLIHPLGWADLGAQFGEDHSLRDSSEQPGGFLAVSEGGAAPGEPNPHGGACGTIAPFPTVVHIRAYANVGCAVFDVCMRTWTIKKANRTIDMEVVPSAEDNTQSRMAENSLVLSRRECGALWGGIDSASRAYEAGTLLDLGCRSMRHRLLHGVRWFETLRRESAVSNFQTQPRDQEGNQQRTVSRNSLE